jgi:thymidylate synthase
MRCGKPVETEDKEQTLESQSLSIKITNPMDDPRFLKSLPFSRAYLDEYTRQVIQGTDSNFDYDYHSRLFHYKTFSHQGVYIESDQIEYMLRKLVAHHASRRAIAVTWSPFGDTRDNVSVPCLQFIQCTIREDKLNMTVMFRSNDMLLAWGCNAYALTGLQNYIANMLGVSIGYYEHISLCPHIYHTRDASVISSMRL